MKKTLVIGGMLLFVFVGFRPPAGIRKFPSANIQFEEPKQTQVYTATVPNKGKSESEAK